MVLLLLVLIFLIYKFTCGKNKNKLNKNSHIELIDNSNMREIDMKQSSQKRQEHDKQRAGNDVHDLDNYYNKNRSEKSDPVATIPLLYSQAWKEQSGYTHMEGTRMGGSIGGSRGMGGSKYNDYEGQDNNFGGRSQGNQGYNEYY